MKSVKRFDSSVIVKRFDSHPIGKNVKETSQGFLVIPAFTARTGIQNYKTSDGKTLREYRPESEVFSSGSMESLRTAVVTDGHPKEMVNPDNAKDLSVGFTNGIVTKEVIDESAESFLGTHIVVTHRDAIEAIKAGKAELSNGYTVDLEFTPGEYNGQKYDAIQHNIINNHIAIVWNARGGKHVALKLDHNDGILITEQQGDQMKITINGKEFEVSDEIGKAILDEQKASSAKFDTEKNRADKLDTVIAELKTTNVKLVAKTDSLESDLEKTKKAVAPVTNVDEAVKARMAIIETGKKLLDSKTVENINDMSNLEIKKAVIKVDSPKIDEKKLENETYVDARFDTIAEKFDSAAKQGKKIGETVIENRENENKTEYRTPDQIRKDATNEAEKRSLEPINNKK